MIILNLVIHAILLVVGLYAIAFCFGGIVLAVKNSKQIKNEVKQTKLTPDQKFYCILAGLALLLIIFNYAGVK